MIIVDTLAAPVSNGDGERITYNGLDLNVIDEYGVEWTVSDDHTGFGDAAAVYSADQRVQADGAWTSKSYRGPMPIGVSGMIVAPTPRAAEEALERLKKACSLDEVPYTWHWATGDFTRYVKRDSELVATRPMPCLFLWQVTLLAPDPALYAGGPGMSDGQTVRTTRLPSSSGGLVFPVTFPVTFTGTSVTGDIVINNPGTGGRLTFRVDGPVEQPQIITDNADGQRTLGWSQTFADGEFLIVDPAAQSALLQGQASRPPSMRQWPRLAAGINTFRFRAAVYSASAMLTVTARPAY